MSLFSNPCMKWGVLPGAIGAGSGSAYAGYLNSADGANYNLGYSALGGAAAGLALAAPGGLTSRARRDFKVMQTTTKTLGYNNLGLTGYSKVYQNL